MRILKKIVCFALCLLFGIASATAKSDSPNVVVLLADDLGWGDISLHGGVVPTPSIDRLFKQGVELETFLVMPVCSPTRAAFLTGRHSTRSGVGPNTINARVGERMDPKETTLAEVFKSAGYKTALIGKWHLGYAPSDPNSKGFDLFYGFLGAATDYMTRTDDPHTRWMLNEKSSPDDGYSTDLIRDGAVRFIAENKSNPFFLYVPFNAVHNPVQAAEQYIARVPASIKDQHARTRAGMLIALDDAVGAIVKRIENEKLSERTIIVFFSDNGPTPDGSAGPFRGRKHTLWEGGVRSPTAIRWSGKLKPGTQTKAMLAAEDLFPTLLKLADVPIPRNLQLDGRDFSACLTSNASSPRDEYCWIWNDCDAIRTARYKLIRYSDRRELYDLQNDIAESRDVSRQHPGLVAELEKRLDAWQAAMPIFPGHVPVKLAKTTKPAPSGDVLEARLQRAKSSERVSAGVQLGVCEPFQLRASDRLEFDVLVMTGSATEGMGMSFRAPERQKKKAQLHGAIAETAQDNGPLGAAVEPKETRGQWQHRVIGFGNSAGRIIDTIWLTTEGRLAANYHLYLDNIVIRRADGSAIEIFRDGKAPEQKRRDTPPSIEVSVRSVPASDTWVE